MNQEVNQPTAINNGIAVLLVAAAPTGVIATANSPTQATISWNSVADATGYNIYQGTSSAGPFNQIGSTVATNFVVTNLTPGTTTYFTVAGYDTSGAGPQSAAVAVSTPASTTDGTLNATALTSGCVQLTWDYTGEGTPVLYRVLRSQNIAGPYNAIAVFQAGTTNYLDCSLANNNTNANNGTSNNYYYIVEVVTETGTAILGPTLVTITNNNGNTTTYCCYNPCRIVPSCCNNWF